MANLTPSKITSLCFDFLHSQTNEVILFYSGGKDSVVLLDMLTKEGFKVHCVFMYFVKNLEHIDKYMNWAKKKYDVEILELPHFILPQYLNDNYYTFHSDREVKNFKLSDVENTARLHFKCDWIVNGAKASDSMVRNFMMKQALLNCIEVRTKHAYPLSKWKKGHIMSYMKQNRLPETINYNSKKKSSGVTVADVEVLEYLKQYYPNDFKKIIEVFPFAEVQLITKDNE